MNETQRTKQRWKQWKEATREMKMMSKRKEEGQECHGEVLRNPGDEPGIDQSYECSLPYQNQPLTSYRPEGLVSEELVLGYKNSGSADMLKSAELL